MKTYEKKVKNYTYKVEEFDTVLEMANINQKRDQNEAWKGKGLRKDGVDEGFCGVSSYEEAYKLLSGGWELGTKKISSMVDKVTKQGMKARTQFFNNVQGFIPNVPLSLMNVPNCMVDAKRSKLKSKVVTLVYDNSASCAVSSEEMIKAGKNIVEAVINLEMSGYRVNVKVSSSFCDPSKKRIDLALATVKRDSQSLNLKKMMFPLSHPAWFRVVGFDWEDKSPVTADHYISGRGYCISVLEKDGNVSQRDLEELLGENVVFIDYNLASKGAEEIENKLTSKNVA